jgi:hypothetical protein
LVGAERPAQQHEDAVTESDTSDDRNRGSRSGRWAHVPVIVDGELLCSGPAGVFSPSRTADLAAPNGR